MKKMLQAACFLLGIFLFLLSGCATKPHTITQGKQEYPRGSVAAVWNLEDVSVSPNPLLQSMGEFLTAKVAESLHEKQGYVLIEREKLLLALEELHLGSSALADESTRLEVGRMIGAQLMVFGGYQQVGEQFRIDLRLVAVESGAVIATAEKTLKTTDAAGWLQAAEEVSAGL